MIQLRLEADIKIIYKQARTFPEGIQEAFETLEKLLPNPNERTYYGISKPLYGVIEYKAGVEEAYDGEAKTLGLEMFVLPKGEYAAETIHNWKDTPQQIGIAFEKLLTHPDLDSTA
ncbi:MAG TPA: hypothetical protein VL947_03895, partial [Cytophagales bacterium]|nr:hypothetical protein [Cytophagales bacterium]